MPRPTTPTLTAYAEQLPDVNSPTTWATRTPLFWNWVTGPGYENMSSAVAYSDAAIDYVDAALAGSETVVDAVTNIQLRLGNRAGVVSYTNTRTLTQGDAGKFLVFSGTSPQTWTLPANPEPGSTFLVRGFTGHNLTLAISGSGVFIGAGCDGFTSLTAYSGEVREVIFDGANWAIINSQADRGDIKLWSGAIAAIQPGWALCDGSNGTPDLRGRFIVGAGGAYGVGATGGADTVTLTETQMPAHAHYFNQNTNVAGNHNHFVARNQTVGADKVPDLNTTQAVSWGNGQTGIFEGYDLRRAWDGGEANVGLSSANGSHAHNVQGWTDIRGSNQAHENRPPYYALAYIMKL